jgi:pyrroline-5-carboxylate reductase
MEKIGIIGLGNMGEAILKAFLRGGIKKEAILCTETKPDRANAIEKAYGVTFLKKPEDLAKKADYIILAVKPQDSRALIQGIVPLINEKKVVISIMAGITTSNILSLFGKPVKVVRFMPNISAKVGEAAIGVTANDAVTEVELKKAKELFSSLGKTVEVGEDLMDAVTALAGSGPAFFLLFLEAMIDGGVKLGITRDKSKILAIQVAKGTVKMLEEEGLHPTVLREMVTSPGGTTIAGLASLEEGAFKGLVMKALEQAARRSRELSL